MWRVDVLEDQGQGLKQFTDYEGESLWQAVMYIRQARKRRVHSFVLTWSR